MSKGRRHGAASLAALLLVAAFLGPAASQPSVSLYYTASTTALPTTTPAFTGINSGHNVDPSWISWAQYLGVNGMRIFGLAGTLATPAVGFPASNFGLQGFINTNGGTWGVDMNGVPVTSQASWTNAVNTLRSPAGHNPTIAAAQGTTYSNPPQYNLFSSMMSTNNPNIPTGGSILSMVNTLQSVGIEPLLVFWMGCPIFSFTSLNPSDPTYWPERWELYKHQYMAAQWAFAHGVRKLEFWNEPDLAAACITYYSFMEYYTLQSQAIQNAYADANADVASGVTNCPPAVAVCPFQPIILASAFAQSTFATGQSSAANANWGSAGSPYKSTFPQDFFAYMGAEAVSNERLPFPPWNPSGTPVGQTLNLQNMNAFSLHSYGKTGQQFMQLGQGIQTAISTSRPAPGPASPATLPYMVTEHAAHTTAVWNTINSHADVAYEASRLGGQIIQGQLNGWEMYIFKFSMADQSLAITPGCVFNSTTSPCGIQKVGLHWSENSFAPFPIGDTTLSAEGARLLISNMMGSYTLETISNPTLASANPYTQTPKYPMPTAAPAIGIVNNGYTRTLAWVNDGANPGDNGWGTANSFPSVQQTIIVNIASWALPTGTPLIHSVAAAGCMGEIYTWPLVSTGANLSVTVPPYAVSVVSAPIMQVTQVSLPAVEDATISAGANIANNYGLTSTLNVGTSVTATHDSTSAALIKFVVPPINNQVVAAVLQLTVATPPTSDMVLLVIGLNPTSAVGAAWQESGLTWATASFAVTQPTGQIGNVASNFQVIAGNQIAGHITIPANTPAGTMKRIDVSNYVQACTGFGGYGNVSFVFARRLRNNPANGNAAGSVAGDTLSGGAIVSFFSQESANGAVQGPTLILMNPTASLNANTNALSLSSTLGIGGYTSATFGPNEQNAFLAVASNQLSVPLQNLAVGGTSTMAAAGRRRLFQSAVSSGVNVNVTIKVNHPTPTGAQTLAAAIATGVTELTGAGNASFVAALGSAGMNKTQGVAQASTPTIKDSNGTDVTHGILGRFGDLLHANLTITNLKADLAAEKTIIAPAAIGGFLLIVIVIVVVYTRKLSREHALVVQLQAEKAAAAQERLNESEARLVRLTTMTGARNGAAPGRAPPPPQGAWHQGGLDRQISASLAPISFGLIRHPQDADAENFSPDWADKAEADRQKNANASGGGCSVQ